MFHLAYAGGLRVSELVGLHLADLTLHPQPTVHVMGKGRRERVLPLWKETAMERNSGCSPRLAESPRRAKYHSVVSECPRRGNDEVGVRIHS